MDRVVFAFYRALAALVRSLPLSAGFRLGEILGAVTWFMAGKYRRLALHNLGIAFGREKSARQLAGIGRAHFRMLGGNLFASLKLPTLSRAELEAVITVEGLDHMQAQLVKKGGFVFVISHLGNWELFAQLTPFLFRCKVGTIYQALGNPLIDAEVRRDRSRLGLALFERKEGFSKAAAFLRSGGAVGVLIDQHAGDAGLWCPFFGRLASTTTLAATLAQRSGAVLIAAAVHTDGPGRWRVLLQPETLPEQDGIDIVTARLNQILEAQIRMQPEDWFWVHDRWKLPRPKFLLATYKRGVSFPPGFEPKDLQPFSLLIRGSNWLGDAVMSVPAVRAIKQGRPDAHLTILTPAKLADFWQAIPEVDAVISIEPDDTVFGVAKKLRSFRAQRSAAESRVEQDRLPGGAARRASADARVKAGSNSTNQPNFRANAFDAAIIFPNSLRTALEVWPARIPRRVGYPGHRRSWLLNQIWREKKSKKRPRQAPRHQVEHYLALARFVGVGAQTEKVNGDRTIENGEAPTILCSPITSHQPKPRFGLCPGAEYGPAKRWLPERFAETMRRVHEQTGCEWHLFGVAKDRPIADEILAAVPGVPVIDRIGQTSLSELITELRGCALLLTNDTGTMHLAANFGIPVVALFGSTEPALTGPLGSGHTVLRHHVPCSPCFLRECPIDFRCMKAIEVSEVVRAVIDRSIR
ncbi:MAG: lipopolysaccharide heptosyltransferase II [Chthoniobacteraceae bacterium]